MVLTDRLSKGIILEACLDITTETSVQKFLRLVYRNHGHQRQKSRIRVPNLPALHVKGLELSMVCIP